jgi:SAM-dependent methyltransferase
MPDIEWNRRHWGNNYPWPSGGEEWSEFWGSSAAQWHGALMPRLHRHLPARNIVEIAPGHGRWTRFLLPHCETFLGVELSPSCTEFCRTRFAKAPQARFATNDGRSMDMIDDGTVDFVFSFDSLVHSEIDVLQSYIPQILRKLAPGGIAFLHHSNLAAVAKPGPDNHGRGHVSADMVADLIANSGGALLVQETVTWAKVSLLDCLTTFGRAVDHADFSPRRIANPLFMLEAAFIGKYFPAYHWDDGIAG